MKRLVVLFAACAALAACSTSPGEELPPPSLPQRTGIDPVVAARAEGVRYMAYGQEPVFHLRFYADRITLSIEDGDAETFPKPPPRYPRWNGEIYETGNEGHELHVEVRRDRRCPTDAGLHVVLVTLDERELSGCGRDV